MALYASIAVNTSDLFISHRGATATITFSGDGHNPARFRRDPLGGTFVDVTPFVPEPSSVIIVTVGMAGFLFRRRH